MAKIRLMIVDDHEMLRVGSRHVFELEPDIHVVGEASSGAEAVAKMSVLDPQVVLMDVRMRNMNGIEACREIKSLKPDVAILMFTSFSDEEAVYASILAGASGYLLKNVGRAELIKAVRHVATGQSLLDPNMTRQAMARITNLTTSVQGNELTEREHEVLALVARGRTNKQIAEMLSIAEKTARNHVSHILVKLGVTHRSAAAAIAVESKFVPRRE